jgi:hypothetical protein
MPYLDKNKRQRVKALISSVNAYDRLQYNQVERDAWLAKDDEQGSRRAVNDNLYEASKEYQRLYWPASQNRKAEKQAAKVKLASGEQGGRRSEQTHCMDISFRLLTELPFRW